MSVTTIGFKEFIDKLNNLPEEIKEEASGYVDDAAQEWEQLAKNAAPVDDGVLWRGIVGALDAPGAMSAKVTNNVEYAPYVEWGTGTRVSVPADLSAYALTFKKNKLTIGRYPHPFFFVQKPLVEAHLLNNLKNLVNTEH